VGPHQSAGAPLLALFEKWLAAHSLRLTSDNLHFTISCRWSGASSIEVLSGSMNVAIRAACVPILRIRSNGFLRFSIQLRARRLSTYRGIDCTR